MHFFLETDGINFGSPVNKRIFAIGAVYSFLQVFLCKT